MTEATIELDILPLIKYDQFLELTYSKSIEKKKSNVRQLTIKLDIKDEDFERFLFRFDQLMLDYKISKKFHGYILYITQTVYDKLDLLSDDLVDSKQSKTILKALIPYLKLKEDKKLFTREKTIRDEVKLMVGNEVAFEIPISTSFVVEAIISKLKTQTANVFLASLFGNKKEFPTSDVLKESIKYLEFITYSPLSLPILEVLEDINSYIVENLKSELSKKRQAFLYDLLHLFDLLIHIRPDESAISARKLKRPSDWTILSTTFKQKIAFIQQVRANYKKRKTGYNLTINT